MTFQDRVKRIEAFRPDIMFRDGAFILKVRFSENWRVIQPEDERIAMSEDNSVKGLWWYVAHIEDVDMLFDLIDETVEANREMERKAALYKEKVAELKELFLSDATYEKLCTLQFAFPTRRKPRKASEKAAESDGKTERPEAEDTPKQPEAQPIESEIDRKIKKAIGKK